MLWIFYLRILNGLNFTIALYLIQELLILHESNVYIYLDLKFRYGYQVCLALQSGYDYMAGGSGKILNRRIVEKIVAINENPELM